MFEQWSVRGPLRCAQGRLGPRQIKSPAREGRARIKRDSIMTGPAKPGVVARTVEHARTRQPVTADGLALATATESENVDEFE